MSSASADPPNVSPWLSSLLRPRQTIEAVVAANPRRQIWLLASLATISVVLIQLLLTEWRAVLLDWRMAAALALFGVVLGPIGLYFSGLFFRWSGRLFGGQAPAVAVRAALAWGQLPTVLVAAVCLVVWVGLEIAGHALEPHVLVLLFSLAAVAMQLWTLVVTWLMLGRVQRFSFWRTAASSILGWFMAILFAGLVAVLIRTFVFQPFYIPSGSMMPTVHVGDYLAVSKFSYGYTHYSLPFSPRLFSGRIFPSEPQRGDIAVHRRPADDRVDYVSRIVGLPGDRIQMIEGRLHINGEPVQRERIEDFRRTENGRTITTKRWRETLPNGVTHETLDFLEAGPFDNTAEYRVPPGHYFVMGDHRDNATDSRSTRAGIFVPFENLIGRASLIYFSTAPDSNRPGGVVGLQRFGVPR